MGDTDITAAATSLSTFLGGAVLLFLFSFSGALEHYAMGRTYSAIRALMDLRPDDALATHQGERHRVTILLDPILVSAPAAPGRICGVYHALGTRQMSPPSPRFSIRTE